jgi:hypothetical protein
VAHRLRARRELARRQQHAGRCQHHNDEHEKRDRDCSEVARASAYQDRTESAAGNDCEGEAGKYAYARERHDLSHRKRQNLRGLPPAQRGG